MIKTNKKKMLTIVLASLFSLTVSTAAFAAITADSAQEIARKWVPPGAVHVFTEADDMEYEVTFLDKSENVKYEVEINKLTEKITEVKTKLQNGYGSQIISLSENDVKDIVLKEFPGATIHRIHLDYEDGYQQYEVRFSTNHVRGEMDINPETGVVIERELKY